MKSDKTTFTDYEMLAALMQNIPDSIYFKDSQSRFIKVNKSTVNKLKVLNESDIIGKTDFDFFSMDHAQKAFNDEQKIIKTGIPVIDKEEKETWGNGEDRWVYTTKMPLKNKEGEIIGTFGISRDITANKKTREDLKAAKTEAEKYAKKAEESDEAKSAFLANMSHEIRTPMNAIMGFSEILRVQLKNPEYIKYIDIIMSSSKTLLELINDILDISKIEAGKMEIQLRPTDPSAVFNDISRIFSQKIKEKGLGFIAEIDQKLPAAILLDEVRLRQILFNLVGNAVKFTSEGYIELKVKGKFYPDKSKIDLIFSVRDTGIGISEENKKEIFNAFQQGKDQDLKKYGGTGLGLTITKKLVELMNGEIILESEVGKGSIFKVIIKEVSTASISSEEKNIDSDILNIKFNNQKVLVTDDIESNRLLLNKMLSLYNLKTIEASNGKEAINTARRNNPDIIIMDLRMPVMDGYEAIKIIKNDKNLSKIPIIVLTASAMKSDEEEIKQIKCEGYLRKPVNRSKLIIELKKHLSYNSENNIDVKKVEIKDFSFGKKKEIISKKIPEILIKNLEELKNYRLKKIKNEFIINDIEDFSKEIEKIGKKFKIDLLINWAQKLLNQTAEFDLTGISGSLNDFNKILEKLKNLNENPK
ncbi:MAG: PAS domain-containing hybrid sensor histidine kinase/response regulator [Candidatus Humimicrobiaceae bacterium]